VQINYIDQIYNKGGTLAQQAVFYGDRLLFDILVRRFVANLTLPFYAQDEFRERQVNCYSVLSWSKHKDPWFM
jgi:hypothetical protein